MTNNTPFVRKTATFYGQVINFEQLSARKRFNPDKLCCRMHLSGEPAHFPDKTCLEVYSEGPAREIKTLDSKVLMTATPPPNRLSMRQIHADG